MTRISVFSRICGTNHTIKGRVEEGRIIVEIDTPCEKFREFAFLEIPVQVFSDDDINLIEEMERQMNCSLECTRECALDCTGQCLIPSAVFDVCSIERELAESRLVEAPFLRVSECTASDFE